MDKTLLYFNPYKSHFCRFFLIRGSPPHQHLGWIHLPQFSQLRCCGFVVGLCPLPFPRKSGERHVLDFSFCRLWLLHVLHIGSFMCHYYLGFICPPKIIIFWKSLWGLQSFLKLVPHFCWPVEPENDKIAGADADSAAGDSDRTAESGHNRSGGDGVGKDGRISHSPARLDHFFAQTRTSRGLRPRSLRYYYGSN